MGRKEDRQALFPPGEDPMPEGYVPLWDMERRDNTQHWYYASEEDLPQYTPGMTPEEVDFTHTQRLRYHEIHMLGGYTAIGDTGDEAVYPRKAGGHPGVGYFTGDQTVTNWRAEYKDEPTIYGISMENWGKKWLQERNTYKLMTARATGQQDLSTTPGGLKSGSQLTTMMTRRYQAGRQARGANMSGTLLSGGLGLTDEARTKRRTLLGG